ncbi:MAG: SurA N-terminal domain-containing protein [Zoogloeaceae bacterium]|jgi:peptidyl-prolyl cis-trans isomerase D|nr:SurA N-terminal domain-containing protein [Zoogloeaceae bacterium]
MFDAVRNHKRIVQFFLLLITVPFAIWGLEAYQRGDGIVKVARVGKVDITQAEFQESLRTQQETLRAQLPPGADAALLNSPAMRENTLNGLIRQQLLTQEIARQRLKVDIGLLREMIVQIPDFQENGVFSDQRYREKLAQNGMTPETFESRALKDIQFQFLAGSLSASAFTPKTVTERVATLLSEQREVQSFNLPWQNLKAEIKLAPADLKAYYDSHQARFSVPEQARVEYLVLENDPEQRRASHILLLTNNGEDKAKVKAEAEKLLEEVKKNPAQFAEIAKKNSQDPGSTANGGDLGFFPSGAMVKPFNDAVFAMKEGEISSIVETDFGYHIIHLTGIKSGRYGDKDFAQVEEEFSDSAYNNSDSLKTTAEAFKLTPQQSGWITKTSAMGNGMLDNPAFLAAVFDDDVVKENHNSKAVEIAPGVMVTARILEHKAASLRPFAEVKAAIETQLTEEKAMALAIQRGETLLTNAQTGKGSIAWSKAETVSRSMPHPAIGAIFKAKAQKLPAYVGVPLPEAGYALYKIVKVTPGAAPEEEKKALAGQLTAFAGRLQLAAYVDALRQRYPVALNADALKEEK